VVVVDADLVFGDVGFYLDIDAKGPCIRDVIAPQEQINDANVEPAIRKHASGLEVVAMPPLADPVFDAQPARLIELVHFLNRSFEYVLVDLPAGVPDALLPLLDDSRYVFATSRGLPERLKNFRNLLRALQMCGFAAPRLCPVLIQTTEEASKKFVDGFQLGVQAYFPRDWESVAEATRAAQPVTRVAPRSPYTQRVRDFVGEVLQVPKAEDAEGDEAKPGLLARLGLGKG
jgi:MinD-like ATPase involved in chromosome partitioning or flagellar assembly